MRSWPPAFDDVTTESLRAAHSYKWTEQGPDLLGAGAAEMDFGTAAPITAALYDAVGRHMLGYLAPSLVQEVRTACARWQQEMYGWAVSPEDVELLPDVVRALQVAVEHFSRPGSPVIVPTPTWPPFLHVPRMLGRHVIEIEMARSGGRYHIGPDVLDRAFATGGHLLVLCNPHNPTGQVLDAGELSEVCAVVERHGGRVFADEVHAPLVHSGHRHIPYATVSPAAARHTITATSASKGWNLPGLKCAQVLLSNDADRESWARLNRLATDGTSTLGAVAAVAAYRHGRPWLDSLRAYLDNNRRLLVDLLHAYAPSVRCTVPEATCLAWLDCRAVPLGEAMPARHFAEHAGVSVLDGTDCGRGGAGFVRLNFGTPQRILTRIVARLGTSVGSPSGNAKEGSRVPITH
jgi:cystathionine beta-lyase